MISNSNSNIDFNCQRTHITFTCHEEERNKKMMPKQWLTKQQKRSEFGGTQKIGASFI